MNNIIYILVNESMPDLVKIGRTNRSIEQRIKELDNTSVLRWPNLSRLKIRNYEIQFAA